MSRTPHVSYGSPVCEPSFPHVRPLLSLSPWVPGYGNDTGPIIGLSKKNPSKETTQMEFVRVKGPPL